MNYFDDLNDTKIQNYKNKISISVKNYITKLSELVNQNNILLKIQKETKEKLELNENEKKKLISELESHKTDSLKQINTITNTIETLNKNITELNNSTKLLTDEKKLIDDKLKQITSEKETLEKEFEKLKIDNSSKIEQIKELQDKIENFEKKSKLDNNTKNECEDLKKQLEEKNKILEEREKLINLCNDKTQLFEKQIDRLKSITDELDNDLNEKTEPELDQQLNSEENMTSELLIKKIKEEYIKLKNVFKDTDTRVSVEYDNDLQEILKPINEQTLVSLNKLISKAKILKICNDNKINELGNKEYCNLDNLFKKLYEVLNK